MDSAGDKKTIHKDDTSLASNNSVDLKTYHSSGILQDENDQDERVNEQQSVDANKSEENISTSSATTVVVKHSKNKDSKSLVSNGRRQIEFMSEGMPVFPSFSKEVVKQTSNISSISAMYCQVSQHCHMNLVQSADQQYSESDEPKLIIDTDTCNSSKEDVHDPESGCKVMTATTNTKPDSHGRSSFGMSKKHIMKRCLSMADRRNQSRLNRLRVNKTKATQRHSRNHIRTCEEIEETYAVNNINNSMTPLNEPIDLSIPDHLKEKLVMKISLKSNPNNSAYQQARSKKAFKRKKHAKDIPVIDDSSKSENYVPTSEQTDADKYKVHVSASRMCSSDDPPLDSKCSKVSLNIKASTNLRNAEDKFFDQAGPDAQISHSGNMKETSSIAPEPVVEGEKFLSLRDRHVMSSLPPKKRRLRKSSRTLKYDNTQPSDPQTKENNHELFLIDQHSDKVQERNAESSSSCNESSSSHIEKTNPEKCLDLSSINHRHLCPVSRCGATFSRKWNLDGHISKVHARLSIVTCSLPGCQKTFNSKRELRQHITMDHKGKTRKYKCSWPECTKSFFARTHLRIHNLTHTGEKPVACDICDYRCRQRTALMWHMRKHGISQKDL